jgi:hypothetical protein
LSKIRVIVTYILLVLKAGLHYTEDMVKKVTEKKKTQEEFQPTKVALKVSAIAAITLVILAIIAVYA